jgi:hypothetical protein
VNGDVIIGIFALVLVIAMGAGVMITIALAGFLIKLFMEKR